ncbi:NADPH--cytochrome P450 reductase [Acipenser ruthenus]|uniref:NADPH--hemoprotein reductase n=1 Tax=Acipenser ruthenus TaxID=7906 RepID=A0A444UFD8_ACIRT|nr:NADPH--cytochrome P450 reductase [Acipenser ruthenus]
MADSEMEMDGGPSGAGAPAEGESTLGMLDVLLFSIIAGLLIFWAVFRKKKEEIPEFKKIPTQAITPRETSFIEKMKKTGKNIVVFYGSQTGTAEEFANRLSKDAQRYGMRGTVADPEEYDMSELSRLSEIDNSIAVFCMATYGEGDPTDNAQDFYDWLQEADDDLSGVNFTVFGLGNKTYEHYNAMGKYVDKRLQQLGAKRIFDLGMGDDDGKYDSGDHVAVYPINDTTLVNKIGEILNVDLDTVISLNNLDGKEVGETVLYYGCRHRNEDFLYQEELEQFEKDGVLTQLNVAFSRDQTEKVYVQHLLKKNKENLWKLIHTDNAHIYICGDARNMARDVQNTFYEIASELGSMTHTQAVDYVKKLMTKGRKEVGETVLYYGCRHRNEDFLYQEELEQFEKDGVLTQLNVAFSRDQAEKVYVQHLLKKNKENLWKLIHTDNAHIYICGDARNMARDVQNTFYEIASELGSMTHTQAVDYVKKLMTKGRYSQDVWS